MIDIEKALKICYPSPQQHPEELRFLANLVNELKPKTILEVGTGCGALTTMLGMSGAKVTTIDWIGNPVQYWDHPHVKKETGKLDITFHLVKDSQTEEAASLVRGRYDLVLIDADHSYAGGKRDFDLYFWMGPVVGIHDIAFYEDKKDHDWFPTRLWYGLKSKDYTYGFPVQHKKLTEISNVPSGGWGIIWK